MQVQEAKDFLVQEIAAEAQAEGIPLSNLERRMLYFTESGDANEDPIALNEQFTAQYDTREYEKKISLLVTHAYRRIKKESSEKLGLWNNSLRVLRKGDHYILVFCKQPNPKKPWRSWTFQLFVVSAVLGLWLLFLFFFGSRGDIRRGRPAPIEKFIPALSPPTQHILQSVFLLLLLLAIFPKLFSKLTSMFWPNTRSNSSKKTSE